MSDGCESYCVHAGAVLMMGRRGSVQADPFLLVGVAFKWRDLLDAYLGAKKSTALYWEVLMPSPIVF